jgi:hypothetical protein
VNSHKKDVSFVGEIRLGGDYWFTPNWRISGGYRALGITGVALSTNQIPRDLQGIDDVIDVDTNGSLILHGGYFGTEFLW